MMTPVLDEVDDLDPKTGHPAPLSTISDLVNAPRPGYAPTIAQRFSALAHCRPTRAPQHVCNRPKQTSTPGPARHTPPHRPRHAACRTDIPWGARNSSTKPLCYRNGTLPPVPPTYTLFRPYVEDEGAGLRRIGFIVSSWVRSSLPWLFSLVDVVAS